MFTIERCLLGYFFMPGPFEIAIIAAVGLFVVCWILKALFFRSRKHRKTESLAHATGYVVGQLLPDSQRTRGEAPSWFLPGGIIALILAILAFLSSAAFWGGGGLFPSIFAGAVNPLFFIGLPLGIYWLNRYASRAVSGHTATTGGHLNTDCSPKLTHCPDCGQHVSRRAASCPHCGAPLDTDIGG